MLNNGGEKRILHLFYIFFLFAIVHALDNKLIEYVGDHYNNSINKMDAFRPTKTTDLLLDTTCSGRVKQWIRETRGRGKVLVIDSASVGVGISTLLRLSCQEENVEAIFISSSVQKLKNFLKDASSSAYTVDFRKKILIIDSFDAVVSEPTCATELSDYIKSISPIPVICVGHRLRSSASKLADMIQKTYVIERVSFPALDTDTVLARLKTIKEALGRSAPVSFNGDLRNSLAALDTDVVNSLKDDQCDGVDAVRRVLFDPSLTIRDSIRMHTGDVSMITAGTHENYPLTGQSIEACAQLADIYSMADVMEECMYATQKWEVGDVCVAITSGGPVAYLDKVASQKHKKIDLSKFGTIWSRRNNMCTKEKGLRALKGVMLEHGMRQTSIDSLATMRGIILSQKWELILPRIAQLPNETLLTIMRLWKCGFTQSNYSALRKKRL
jgi:hypothetical protein